MIRNTDKPTRCIDPVIKYCQGCEWGHITYPAWVETAEDLAECCFETNCILGFDQGRPEDEPTEAEIEEFNEWARKEWQGNGQGKYPQHAVFRRDPEDD